MKSCDKCSVQLEGDYKYCPLCKRLLNPQQTEGYVFPEVVETATSRYQGIMKVINFLALTIISITIILNLLLPINSLWVLITIGTVGCIWISVLVAIRKHKNVLKYMLYQSYIIQFFAMFVDYRTGWDGWSIAYVLPVLCVVVLAVMYTLSKVLKLDTGDYMIYILLDVVFGVIPIVCLRWGIIQNEWLALGCLIVSIITFIGLVIFEGQRMYSELKRRLHV